MSARLVADVIVIGLGAFGSAVACQLARRGAKVIGIDRFHPPHELGSSHGATRITRLAVGEGAQYVPFVRRSHEIWRTLESELGPTLYLRTGGLIMGPGDGLARHHGRPNFVQQTIDVAQRFGIAHEVLRAADVHDRFPQFLVRGDELAYYEGEAGVLLPERCVAAHLESARAHGATLRMNEPVLSIQGSAGGVEVRTGAATYSAAKAVLATGAWVPGMAEGAYRKHLRVMRQVLHWFRPAQPELFASPRCPVFIWMHGCGDTDLFYGFPMVDGHDGVKVATEQYQQDCDPDRVDRTVQPDEPVRMFETHVSGKLRSVTPECVRSVACLYTVSTDSGFVVDAHPSEPNVTVISACSGHGFKHSAGLGEAVAQQVLGGGGHLDLGAFSLDRFSRA